MRKWVFLLLGASILLSGGLVALAQDGYKLSWWTVDGGGHMASVGGGYALDGTTGQPDAGVLAGSGYTLGGGFWQGGSAAGPAYKVYLPVVLRGF